MTLVLMTEPELLTIFKAIIETDAFPGTKMELILKLLRLTNWLEWAKEKEI